MPEFRRTQRTTRSRWPILLLIVLVLAIPVALGFLVYHLLPGPVQHARLPESLSAPQPTVGAEPTPTLTPLASETPLPELDQSDPFVRGLVGALSSHPEWVKWLATEGLTRRFVLAVDNVAEGRTPTKPLAALAPKRKFLAVERHGEFFVDPQSYRRYDTVADVVASLDVEGTARSYRQLKPLIQDAYSELGYPDHDFDLTLARAIDRILDTPIPKGEVQLRPGVRSYKLADPQLEDLSPIQKQFLRLGPDNMTKVKDKLRAIRDALSLPKDH
jgi:Protein of unknown function (DUF3014)